MIVPDSTNAEAWLLNLPPTKQQRRWAVAVAICQLAALALTVPFAGIPLGQMNGFIPAVEAVVFVTDLVTSVLLFSQFAAHRLNPLLVLACGYLFSALIIIPHALSFPGAFSPVGLPGAGLQTTPWLYWFWHLPFAMTLLGYGMMSNEKSEPSLALGSSLAVIVRSIALVLALVCGLVLVATAGKEYLPAIFADIVRGVPANSLADYVPPAITIAVCVSAFAVLWLRRRSVLDQWLMVVALSVILEVVIVVFVSPKRFDVGFYAGRLFSLLTSTTIMIVLLMETIRLYANVARSNQDKIRRLVDANIIGIIIWDIEGKILDCNDAFLRTVGYERKDIKSGRLRWTDLTPPEWRTIDEQRLAEIKASGTIQAFEKEYIRKDGTRVPVLIGAATFDDSKNQGIAFVVDLTERKQADEALRRSEAFLAKGQELSQTGTFSWRFATDEFIWSDELYRIYEFEPGVDITFEKIATRYHPEDKTIIAGVAERARLGVMGFDYTHRILMPDGSVKHIHVVAHGSRDKDGQLEYFGAVQDITQRHLADEALNRARTELAHMARVTSLGALTASIAHEVNQPLSGIITNASTGLRMLRASSPDLDGARETTRRTIRDANRAAEIISRLRALFARRKISAEMVDLNEALREVISLSLREIQNGRVTLQSEFADDLPPVQCDRIQVQQVLLNLIRNAAEAMSDVTDRPRQLVIRAAKAESGGAIVSVRDSGPGIDPANLERVFDALYTTKTDGLGIGLSICRTIVEAHGGKLWATAAVPHGAIFQFTLPVANVNRPINV